MTNVKDECRHCNQSVLTVFLWNPRLGQLNNMKDKATQDHYKHHIEAESHKIESKMKPQFSNGCPYIQGPFTGWRPVKMRSLLPTLEAIDEHKPDFIAPAVKEGKVR